MSKTPSMRIDRLLANMGYGSRREIREMTLANEPVHQGRAQLIEFQLNYF